MIKSNAKSLPDRCNICGKSVDRKRAGSLTSWIFGETNCQCTIRRRLDDKTTDQFALPESKLDSPPVIDKRYQLNALIAVGGMARIYSAIDTHLDKECIIKVLRPEYLLSEAGLQRFGHETRMCAGFNHPNLVAVTDYDISEEGTPYLVMDLIKGNSLRELIDSNIQLSRDEILSIFIQICNAVEYAHQNGLIHRDIKPENILIEKDHLENFVVKLLDFGIAKPESAGGEIQRLTQTGEVFGSPHYMSPEQCKGAATDERSDIYAIGCVLYEVQTSQPPFRGPSFLEILNGHTSQAIEKPSSLKKDCWIALESITIRCLEKKPENRYQSATHIKEGLLKLKESTKKRLPFLQTAISLFVIGALFLIPMMFFNSNKNQFAEKANPLPPNENREWQAKLTRSNLLREQKLYNRSKILLEHGLKEGLKNNAPLEDLLSFTLEYIRTANDSWPDIKVRKENFRFSKALFQPLKIPIQKALEKKEKNKYQSYVRNLIAMNYFYLYRLAEDARNPEESYALLSKADKIYRETPDDIWLGVKINTFLGGMMKGEASYKRLKQAYNNLVKLHAKEPAIMKYSTTPPRLYRELALVCNRLKKHDEAAKFAKLGLSYRGKSILGFDKNYINTMENELEKATAGK